MDAAFNISAVVLLVILNGFFVASEFALVSIRKTRVAELVKTGNRAAKRIQHAQADMVRYISGAQLGNTLVSLALGWVGEPFIARILEPGFARFIPEDAAKLTSHGVAVVSAFSLISYLLLVLGEIVPKSIGFERAEKTALFIIRPLELFVHAFRPVIYILSVSGRFAQRIIGLPPSSHSSSHSEEEIKMLISQSAESGDLEKKEVEMVYRVFKLADTQVESVMVPRKDMVAFNARKTLAELEQALGAYTHSRFPVYKQSLNNILGFVHIKDFFRAMRSANAGGRLERIPIVRSILTVKAADRVDDVLLLMRKRRIHMAIVQNAGGGTIGLVTLEDLVERLVGDIQDEFG